MSRRAESQAPSDAPPAYEDGERQPQFSTDLKQSDQGDSKSRLNPHVHNATASTSTGLPPEPAPHGLFGKLKDKKAALKQNLDEGIARGKSAEGTQLANQWNSQHLYASFGVPVASIEKWQEHKDKKELEKLYREVDWDETAKGNGNSKGSS